MKLVKYYMVELLTVLGSIALFMTYIILYRNQYFLVSWIPIKNVFWIAFICIVFSSLFFAVFKLYKHNKFKEQILNDNTSKPYYYIISTYFVFVVLYMITSSLFTSNNYAFMKYFYTLFIACIALFIVYLPSLFIDMINDSVTLSIIYIFMFNIIIQIILFLHFYLAYFVSGV